MKKFYGYCYDKQGNLKEVSAPVTVHEIKNEDCKKVATAFKSELEYPKTKTGKLHSSVGFSIGEQTKY